MKKINVAVAVIINEKGQILLTQRNEPDNPLTHLKWQLPGGGVEEGEQVENACIREAYEETGLKINLIQKNPAVFTNIYDSRKYVVHGFKANVVSGTINVDLDEETKDAKWVEKSEIENHQCLDNTLEMVNECLKL